MDVLSVILLLIAVSCCCLTIGWVVGRRERWEENERFPRWRQGQVGPVVLTDWIKKADVPVPSFGDAHVDFPDLVCDEIDERFVARRGRTTHRDWVKGKGEWYWRAAFRSAAEGDTIVRETSVQ